MFSTSPPLGPGAQNIPIFIPGDHCDSPASLSHGPDGAYLAPHQLVPVCLTTKSHKPSSFLVLLPRMGRAGSSSSSVPSSSPSLSLSEEKAGPEGGTAGAWCLSPRQERSQKRRLTGQEADNDGLVHEKEGLGIAGAAEQHVLHEAAQGITHRVDNSEQSHLWHTYCLAPEALWGEVGPCCLIPRWR